MIKPFIFSFLLIVLMALGLSTHYMLFNTQQYTQQLQQLSAFTSHAKLSMSVKHEAGSHNMTYPEMPTLSKMDFVYEQ